MLKGIYTAPQHPCSKPILEALNTVQSDGYIRGEVDTAGGYRS